MCAQEQGRQHGFESEGLRLVDVDVMKGPSGTDCFVSPKTLTTLVIEMTISRPPKFLVTYTIRAHF